MIQIVRMNEKERQALVSYCRQHDVRRGGCFDVRGDENSGAVNVWSSPWDTEENTERSEPVGTILMRRDHITVEGPVISLLVRLPLKRATENRGLVLC
ncbi:hypothetical protein HYR54_12890 [Candidatus Acetothermia bacterium]|nr:hypothetical protein [Candidatus Acetothermia bacterium]